MDKHNVKQTRVPLDTEQHQSIEALAEQQQVRPFSYERLRLLGDVWPEDENVDEFIAAVRQWRAESR